MQAPSERSLVKVCPSGVETWLPWLLVACGIH